MPIRQPAPAPRRDMPRHAAAQPDRYGRPLTALAMRLVEFRVAAPLGVLEVFEGRHAAGSVLAERQGTGRELRMLFRDQDDADAPFRQAAGGLQQLDLALLVEPFKDGSHSNFSG